MQKRSLRRFSRGEFQRGIRCILAELRFWTVDLVHGLIFQRKLELLRLAMALHSSVLYEDIVLVGRLLLRLCVPF